MNQIKLREFTIRYKAKKVRSISTRRKMKDRIVLGMMSLAIAFSIVFTLALIVYIAYKAIPNIHLSFLLSSPSYLDETFGILPALLNTLYLLLITLLIVVPLGVGAAIYLNEYCSNPKIVALIEYTADILSGIPSILYGLIGMLFFCQFFDLQM